jgi:pimeloyl-ACP methyl ester carboxylesterase
MCTADKEILKNKNIACLFSRDQKEAVLTGSKGATQDLETQWKAWDFDLKDIKVPTHIFQGKMDTFVPWQFAEHLANTLPNAKLHLYEDRGHLFLLLPSFQDELFRRAQAILKFSQNESFHYV